MMINQIYWAMTNVSAMGSLKWTGLNRSPMMATSGGQDWRSPMSDVWGGGGEGAVPGHMETPSPCDQIDTVENITFPKLGWRPVIIELACITRNYRTSCWQIAIEISCSMQCCGYCKWNLNFCWLDCRISNRCQWWLH